MIVYPKKKKTKKDRERPEFPGLPRALFEEDSVIFFVHRGQKSYTSYEGLHLPNQISRKLGVFDRKLEGNHSIFHCYSDIY